MAHIITDSQLLLLCIHPDIEIASDSAGWCCDRFNQCILIPLIPK